MDTSRRPGPHFLQIPGPSRMPERIRQAIAMPLIDHRGPEFARLGTEVLDGLRRVFRTNAPVLLFPGSGTAAWEAALVNVLSSGDRVIMFDSGHFANLWSRVATRLGLVVDLVPCDWRAPVDADAVATRLAEDRARRVKAVCIVHNETSTGVTSSVPDIRAAIDRAGHPALLLVDAVSSLGCVEYRHDAWGVDVTVSASQKGLMLPPGLGFNAVSERALACSDRASLPRSYWDWGAMIEANRSGMFPSTPPTSLLYGLRVALAMLDEEGLDHVAARHARHGAAVRTAVEAWGLEIFCRHPAARSDTVTAVMTPPGHDADALRERILERFDMSLGAGLGRTAGQVFRIGHLGDLNDLMLCATLAGIEMGLAINAIPHAPGGTTAAMGALADLAS